MSPSPVDLAGESYWTSVWRGTTRPRWRDPTVRSLRNHVNYTIHTYLEPWISSAASALEVGCARSIWLPTLARRGIVATGLDYSADGCEQSRAMLVEAGTQATVVQGDLFAPAPELIERFDVALSFGLVEHFHDTASCLAALGRLVRPRGRVITLVPNLAGWMGAVLQRADPDLYALHVPLTPETLSSAAVAAHMKPEDARYLVALNPGVLATRPKPTLAGRIYSAAVTAGRIAALPVWAAETVLGPFPTSRHAGAYVAMVATKVG